MKQRQRQNLVVAVAVLALLGVGLWLVDRLLANRTVQNCIEAHHRNCVPLELPNR